ncbi:hypothetical protein D8674_010385 [Pyrus ussuriensis x Pyrus communis]|uniref:Uncharacterized protein n=1 Tax=Pyrus ussuriensis x Pyrus communis TaxID=2448454 RepID=A0A5N5FPC4_9ROSA|nr:hypothetical protein D8674_010385 [Pyrus ussuriensis x Pyrus communis]
MVDCGARSSKTMDGEDMCARFWSDVGVLVHDKCRVDWESSRAIPEELKMHLIDELAICFIDNIFKSHCQEWKFDNQHVAELQREPEPLAEE